MKLIFADPLLVSNDYDLDFHSVSIEVLEPTYFTSINNDGFKD